MKIGILTFHSQINYGGILQCFALQQVLKKMGHEVVVIDRRFSNRNSYITNNKFRSLRYLVNFIHGRDVKEKTRRYINSQKFISHFLNLSSYSFVNWKDAPKKLDLDIIIVGSDQIWNCIWQDPGVYLLEDAPKVPAISYAASFGMNEIPAQYINRFKNAFTNFSAISVREYEGKCIVNKIGEKAALVVDPSLLLSSRHWFEELNIKIDNSNTNKRTKRIVCYFIKEDISKVIKDLSFYTQFNNCKIDILLQEYYSVSAFEKTRNMIYKYLFKSDVSMNNIQIKYSAGPHEFVELFAKSDAIISDSFHALMFACIFRKNIRIIRPYEEIRSKMFSRISEFIDNYINGKVICNNVSEALSSLDDNINYKEEDLNKEILYSYSWLKSNIEQIKISK